MNRYILTLSPASSNFCRLLITFANSFDPDQAHKMSGLIWVQTVWHSDVIPERLFWKSNLKKQKYPQTTKKHAK